MLEFWEQYKGGIDSSKLSLSKENAEVFFKKKKGNCACFTIRKTKDEAFHLETSYFIGVDYIPDGNKKIYVAPKLNTKTKDDGSPDETVKGEDIRETNYLRMLFEALKHPEIAVQDTHELFEIKWDAPTIKINQKQDLLTPLLVVQFLRVVQQMVRKGLKKSYYPVEQNLNGRVKGKILVGQTIKQNLLKNKQLNTYCRYDEFGINGLENRLVKKALLFVQRYLPELKIPYSEDYTTRVFNYIMPAFEQVSDEVSLNDIKHTKTNVFYKEYEEGIRLARLILKRFGYNISNTEKIEIQTPPFWIDMSKLFELYVLGLLKDRFGPKVKYQVKARGQVLDYLITKKGHEMVVDAKYKVRYKKKCDKEDMRQVSGYARLESVYKKLDISRDQVIDCLIIYPDMDDGIESFNDVDLKKPGSQINGWNKFYKVGVRLPLISDIQP